MASRALHLARHLAQAADARDSRRESTMQHQQLLGHVQRMKMLSARAQRPELNEACTMLEQQLTRILRLEQTLLRKERIDTVSLQRQIHELREQLALSGSDELRRRLGRIEFLIGELGARVDTYVGMKERHDRRVEELEQRIKSNIDRNFQEILAVEKSIAALEKRAGELRQERDVDQSYLRTIDQRLDELRQRLFAKKLALAGKRGGGAVPATEKQKPEAEESAALLGAPAPPLTALPSPEQHRMLFPPPMQQTKGSVGFPLFKEKPVPALPAEELQEEPLPEIPPPPGMNKPEQEHPLGSFLKRLFRVK